MGYASIAGRARTSASSPRAHAICDRCGFRFNHNRLSWQYDWAGGSVINKRILVCPPCVDRMQEQLRTITLPADPMPIQNPRPENFVYASSDVRVTQDGATRVTESLQQRTLQATGEPPGGLNQRPGTSIKVPDDAGGNDPGLPYNYDEVPQTGNLS